MSTEEVSSRYEGLDAWAPADILSAIVESNQAAVEAVRRALPALTEAAERMVPLLEQGGRIVYLGAGTSGRLALQDAAELPPTFSFDRTQVLMAGGSDAGSKAREGAEDDRAAAEAEVAAAGVGPLDSVIGLAASGRTPYTVSGLEAARAAGALTIGLANNAGTRLLEVVDVPVLLDSGPEVLAGSTRLAAGTAQKIALGALSTTVLVKLGGAYQNLMVGMKPANVKLRRRAADIVARAADTDSETATARLSEADWDMRAAIVSLKAGISPEAAARLVSEAGNDVRRALELAVSLS